MQGPYNIEGNIDREAARMFLFRLATENELRAEVEEDPSGVLERELGLTIGDRALDRQGVDLPAKKDLLQLLAAGEAIWPDESAEPFGWLILFVFGAMPVTMRGRPAGDGAG